MSQNHILRDKNYSNYKPAFRKTLLSAIALSCKQNTAWVSLLTGPSPSPAKPICLLSLHMGTISWSTWSPGQTSGHHPGPSLHFSHPACQSLLSPNLFALPPPVPPQLRPPHLLFSPVWTFAPAWHPGLQSPCLQLIFHVLRGVSLYQSWPCFAPAQSLSGSHHP